MPDISVAAGSLEPIFRKLSSKFDHRVMTISMRYDDGASAPASPLPALVEEVVPLGPAPEAPAEQVRRPKVLC